MDHLPHLHRETRAFEAAARRAATAGGAPLVPGCPGWSVTDLVAHLGAVQRLVTHIVRERLTEPPDTLANLINRTPSPGLDLSFLHLPADRTGWPDPPEDTPHLGPLPPSLVDWYAEGAAALEDALRTAPDVHVWTWGQEQTVGFWRRVQTVEAALHRWDAEGATGTPAPFDPALAADGVAHHLDVMVPARRAWREAPPGSGESYRFRRTDGDGGDWTVRFDGADVVRDVPAADCAVELAGTASDLLLFLWNRLPADRAGTARGETALLARYPVLVPPV
ncbi:hypothetical protein GCM10010218_56540 [Streptomyces mashuensis]|uniref:Maleylpyruvate isomerase family mycothiol-dependent enzyme n=1 Tax=Streptomyces mashuensis TaxID=33904 RepID=A0A919B8H1_9ACTN|nr:maleylpyruvate isomerase family mycothiol-dependent enzyme [Streptomyces mashuensis]GHF67740.1 hypothetical protein GCM10010218_56540 [Streptomyces mashuensis]